MKGARKMKPVCLVIGAGAGVGGNVGKKFANEGFHVCLCRRSNKEGLDKLVEEIETTGGTATGFILNAVEQNSIEDIISHIESKIGYIEAVVYNLGAQIGNKTLAETNYKSFEMGWRLGTFGLFRTATAIFPAMEKRKKGVLLVTSSTAAVRGNEQQHSHAAAMGGRRMLCQTLNAEFSIKGIHICHIIIDGAVDAPDTLGKMLGSEKFEKLRKEKGLEKDGLMRPESIAETYLHIAKQHRSTWTHEIDLRAFSDTPWWNTEKAKYL